MGLICGTNAGAHQKNKSSSNESLTLPEWITIISTVFLGNELILKPLGSGLLSRSGNNKNKLHVENDEQNNIKYTIKNNDENYEELKRRNYIQDVLNFIDKTVYEDSESKWFWNIPNSLGQIRMALHCLFLNYSRENDKDIKNAKLTIGEKIDWSFTYDKENYVSLDDVRKILEWYHEYSNILFYNNLTPIEKFGFVIQKWAKEMGFKSVEIVMDGVGSQYAGDHCQSSIKVKIHGFKYQLSDKERQNLMDRLKLQGGDVLEVVNDDEEIEENIEDKNNIIIVKEDYDSDDD